MVAASATVPIRALILLFVSVCVVSMPANVVELPGSVMVVLSVPVKAMVLLTVSVLPSAIVSVAPVVGAVKATLLTLVADATPKLGVVRLGLVAKTNAPEPVSSVTAAARFALEGVARNVAMPDPKPLIPVLTGNPVQFVSVPDAGVPKAGVTNVGLVARTTLPVPVLAVHSGAVAPAFT